jgi:hypothetical protein
MWPWTYEPTWGDSVLVMIAGGQNPATTIYVDRAQSWAEGISDFINGQKVSLLPNPAGEKAELRFSNPGGKTYLFSVTDMSGRIVCQERECSAEQITFDRAGLPAGLYFWVLRNEKTGERSGGKMQFQ